MLEESMGIPEEDDLGLLVAVSNDLPGAVEILSYSGEVEDSSEDEELRHDAPTHERTSVEEGLRFSLAGVQLKFSVLRVDERIVLPAHDERGDWIIKLDSPDFPHLVENEFAIMEWARQAGFSVPECELRPSETLPERLQMYAAKDRPVFLIRRFDRDQGIRIHQEDFAQVLNIRPHEKYSAASYDQIASIVVALAGESGYLEFIRRLAFVVASGNADAHLKNWSVLYLDGVTATLAPLYDQVATVAWPRVSQDLSLTLGGTKALTSISIGNFERLATAVHMSEKATVRTVQETLDLLSTSWVHSAAAEVLVPSHLLALRQLWSAVPLLGTFQTPFQE